MTDFSCDPVYFRMRIRSESQPPVCSFVLSLGLQSKKDFILDLLAQFLLFLIIK